jgi:predicted DNA-binding transcriptional regulator YafY
MLCAPRSRMDVLTDEEIDAINAKSKMVAKYNKTVDSESAYEILTAKLEEAAAKSAQEEVEDTASSKKSGKEEKSTLEKVADNTIVKSMIRTAGTTIVRSLLGALGLGGRSRSSKSKGWFG